MSDKRIGIYPGTFDPITNGHVDIIKRAIHLFDNLVIGVAISRSKVPLFTVEERVALIEKDLKNCLGDLISRIKVVPFSVLLVHFAQEMNAQVIVRGLRVVTDFDYELQMAGMNSRLDSKIQTVFLIASEGCQFICSSLVKEIAALGGDISSYVSSDVCDGLIKKYNHK